MPTTSIRTAAKVRLVELLAVELTPVQVAYAWPGEDAKDECVFLGGVQGNVSVRDMRSGRKARDDTFTIAVHFYAGKPGQKAQEADERAEVLYSALENVLADNPKLGDLDGILWAAQMNDSTEYREPEADAEGYVGEVAAFVQVKTLLR